LAPQLAGSLALAVAAEIPGLLAALALGLLLGHAPHERKRRDALRQPGEHLRPGELVRIPLNLGGLEPRFRGALPLGP
jgi:hypothetical protein